MGKRGTRAGVFSGVLASLRNAEQELERQLAGIKRAISSLEFGGFPAPGRTAGRRRERPSAITKAAPKKRRKLSAKARRAISLAQKRRWAKLKKAENQ
jgi:hypothetical protein